MRGKVSLRVKQHSDYQNPKHVTSSGSPREPALQDIRQRSPSLVKVWISFVTNHKMRLLRVAVRRWEWTRNCSGRQRSDRTTQLKALKTNYQAILRFRMNKTDAFVWLVLMIAAAAAAMYAIYQEMKALIAMITVWQIPSTVTFCDTTAKRWRGSTVILHIDIVRLVVKQQKQGADSLWRAQTDCDRDQHSALQHRTDSFAQTPDTAAGVLRSCCTGATYLW